MPEELDEILRRVAAGELSPQDAEPLVAAATGASPGTDTRADAMPPMPPTPPAPPSAPHPPTPPAPDGAPPSEGRSFGRGFARGFGRGFSLGFGDDPGSGGSADPAASSSTTPSGGGRASRTVRLQVMESGRAVVNLRIPMSWASLAGSVVPGLSGGQAERLREAIRSGEVGPILEVRDDDGDGVIISTE